MNSERYGGDARAAVAPEARRLDRRRIGLQPDFDALRNRPVACDRFEHGPYCFRLHQRRRAAAQKDACNGARTGPIAHRPEFAREGAGKALLIHRLVADMGIEVTIGALGRAERPVDVDTETRLPIVERNHTGALRRSPNFFAATKTFAWLEVFAYAETMGRVRVWNTSGTRRKRNSTNRSMA